VVALRAGRPPVFEPGLAEPVRQGLDAGRLQFSSDLDRVGAETVWVAFDTAVDENDEADVEAVVRHVETPFPHLRAGAVVLLLSSRVPGGTTARLEKAFASGRRVEFACSPEVLRLGKALDVFRKAPPHRRRRAHRDGRAHRTAPVENSGAAQSGTSSR
jgi:UDPglucose 6-dehydrogenase